MVVAWVEKPVARRKPAVHVHGEAEAGDVTVARISYAVPERHEVHAYVVWRPAERHQPGPGIGLVGWGDEQSGADLLDEAISLARDGYRTIVAETHAPAPGADVVLSVVEAVDSQQSALDALVRYTAADADRLGLVAIGPGAALGTLLARADPRVQALTVCGYRDGARRSPDMPADLVALDPHRAVATGSRRLLVQHIEGSGAVRDDARALYEAAPRPRTWLEYDGALSAAQSKARADRAAFLEAALTERTSDAAGALGRWSNRLSSPDWWLTDPHTGEQTPLAQPPNTAALLWNVLLLVRVLGVAPDRDRELELADLAVGGLWGLDELVRGTNPARRMLGLGAIGVQSVRAALRR